MIKRERLLYGVIFLILFTPLYAEYYTAPSDLLTGFSPADGRGSFYSLCESVFYPKFSLFFTNRFLMKEFSEYGIEYGNRYKNIYWGIGVWSTNDSIYNNIGSVLAVGFIYNDIKISYSIKDEYSNILKDIENNIYFNIALSVKGTGIVMGYENSFIEGVFGIYNFNDFILSWNIIYREGFTKGGMSLRLPISKNFYFTFGSGINPMFFAFGIDLEYSKNKVFYIVYKDVNDAGTIFSIGLSFFKGD